MPTKESVGIAARVNTWLTTVIWQSDNVAARLARKLYTFIYAQYKWLAFKRLGQTSPPPIDPRVVPHFEFAHAESAHAEFYRDEGAVYCYPVGMDTKQLENARNFLIDRKWVGLTDDRTRGIPILASRHPNLTQWFCTIRPPISIVLDLHDSGDDSLLLSPIAWRAIREYNLQVIYLKLQVTDAAAYPRLNLLPNQVHVVSLPMLLGGSRFHITNQQDYAGENLYRRIMRTNENPTYEFDWSWIGSVTSQDRRAAQPYLEKMDQRNARLVWTQAGQVDTKYATVPYDEYMEINRRSRMIISLNGYGPWCLKDGEIFANHGFCLRQHHPTLLLNPLSPKDGIHWAIFETERIAEAVDYYLHHDAEREQIRDHGFAYLQSVLFDSYYADYYAPRLAAFIQEPRKEHWDSLTLA